MEAVSITVADGMAYKNYAEVLEHIYQKQYADGIVRESYLKALQEREADYPTGILFDGYAVAIPHCDSQHAIEAAIYILRLPQAVEVSQADGDEKLPVRLILNLVVTQPSAQLPLLKALFKQLQLADFYHQLLQLPAEEAKALFVKTVVN